MKHTQVAIDLSLDGDQWCAIIGENIAEGVAGFGASPIDALENLCSELRMYPWNEGDITIG